MMATSSSASEPTRRPAPRWRRRAMWGLLIVLGVYLVIAYLFMPWGWKFYARRHPALDSTPNITYTSDKHPGDPINVAIIAHEEDFKRTMLEAGWFPADPITLKSCLEIAAGTLLHRPYDDAPVSPLFLDGRKQDLAFEQPVGHDPRQRHHVRFWKSREVDDAGRPAWFGSATYDRRVGLSHTTGEITHHIAADVDAERDHLFADLKRTGKLVDIEVIPGFHTVLTGRNGGGDPWHTDGDLDVGTIQR